VSQPRAGGKTRGAPRCGAVVQCVAVIPLPETLGTQVLTL